MKKRWLLLILVLIYAALLSACKGKPAQATDADEAASAGMEQTEGTAQDQRLVREDEEGLVRVEISSGSAEIMFQENQWGAYYGGISQSSRLQARVYPIITIGDKVKDACIGRVAELRNYEGIVLPAVMLLMEDGTVEYLLADALREQMDDVYCTFGLVPWLEGIETLSYEKTGEGVAEGAIYATDASGVSYDATLAAQYRFLHSGKWQVELEPIDQDWGGYTGVLVFIDDTQVEFLIKSTYEVSANYCGTYRFVLTEEDSEGYGKGIMVFDLLLDWTIAEGVEEGDTGASPRREIHGAYFAEMTSMPELNLWIAEGDSLYDNQYSDLDSPKTEYTFGLVPEEGEMAMNDH